MESGTVKMLCPSKDNQYLKCAISVSGTAVFNGGEVLTQVTSPGGEREKRYLSRRLQAIRGEAGGSVTINGGTFDRVVLHSAPTPENRGKYELVDRLRTFPCSNICVHILKRLNRTFKKAPFKATT